MSLLRGLHLIHFLQVMATLKAARLPHGLVPIFVECVSKTILQDHPESVSIASPKTGMYQASSIRLGSRGDSYYEYLLLAFRSVSHQRKLLIFLGAENNISKL